MSKLAIIAGAGDLPRNLIQACLSNHRSFVVVAFPGHTDPETYQEYPHIIATLGKIGDILKHLKEAHVTEIVMGGRFRRPAWSELKLDLVGLKWMAQSAKGIFGDDSLLRMIIHNLEKENFKVLGAEDILGAQVLVPAGPWGQFSAFDDLTPDIHYGFKILKALGQCDIGQAVVIQQGLVLGVETIEGTDQLLDRCQFLKRAGPGGILIKGLKPQQEHRVDRPTVGLETVERALRAGLQGIILEAHQVIVHQKSKMIETADAHKFFIEGRVFESLN